jgi:hypothetical protein
MEIGRPNHASTLLSKRVMDAIAGECEDEEAGAVTDSAVRRVSRDRGARCLT